MKVVSPPISVFSSLVQLQATRKFVLLVVANLIRLISKYTTVKKKYSSDCDAGADSVQYFAEMWLAKFYSFWVFPSRNEEAAVVMEKASLLATSKENKESGFDLAMLWENVEVVQRGKKGRREGNAAKRGSEYQTES